jgi:ABC-type uncharacterized transport system fused permease/ATPase subunit
LGGPSGGAHNPECRIADDVRIATKQPVEFGTGVTAAVLSAATFIGYFISPADSRALPSPGARASRMP